MGFVEFNTKEERDAVYANKDGYELEGRQMYIDELTGGRGGGRGGGRDSFGRGRGRDSFGRGGRGGRGGSRGGGKLLNIICILCTTLNNKFIWTLHFSRSVQINNSDNI